MASSPPKSFGTWLKIIFKYGLAAAGVALIALIVAVGVAIASLPDYDELAQRDDLGQMIRVRAADGSVLVTMGPSFGQWLPYDRIPATMRAAMISVEDKRFRSHLGVDPIGMARSVKVRVETGRWRQGGSTITQQLARNIFLTNSRTFGRKVKEGVLALALERKFSKDQILELYLNRVYFGGGAYGIDAASRTFFGHGAERSAWARRRSSPGWSRRRPIIPRPPTSRPRAAAPGWWCNRWSTMASSAAAAARSIPARIQRPARRASRTARAISPTGRCPSSIR